MMMSGGCWRAVRIRVSLLSPHPEHRTRSPPLRTDCLKNSDRQSCRGPAGHKQDGIRAVGSEHTMFQDKRITGDEVRLKLPGWSSCGSL